jgi:hypothetical protein
MVIDVRQFEVDRLVNMLRAFGWAVTATKFEPEKVIVTVEKEVKPEG